MKVAMHFYLLFASEPFANILESVYQTYDLNNYCKVLPLYTRQLHDIKNMLNRILFLIESTF